MAETTSSETTVGVRELKAHLSQYLDRARAGEEITVTEHGRPVARLTAVAPEVDHMAELVAAGIVRPARARRRQLPTRRAKLAGEGSVAELVAEQRR